MLHTYHHCKEQDGPNILKEGPMVEGVGRLQDNGRHKLNYSMLHTYHHCKEQDGPDVLKEGPVVEGVGRKL
jgi:hypothetical protein